MHKLWMRWLWPNSVQMLASETRDGKSFQGYDAVVDHTMLLRIVMGLLHTSRLCPLTLLAMTFWAAILSSP